LSLIEDQNEFIRMRTQLLALPTSKQSQVNKRVIASTFQDDVENSTIEAEPINSVVPKQKQWIDRLILHYTHEKRFASYKRDIHQTWNKTFVDTPVTDVKLLVGHRNNRNLQCEIVRKRPIHSMSYTTNDKSTISIFTIRDNPTKMSFRRKKDESTK